MLQDSGCPEFDVIEEKYLLNMGAFRLSVVNKMSF